MHSHQMFMGHGYTVRGGSSVRNVFVKVFFSKREEFAPLGAFFFSFYCRPLFGRPPSLGLVISRSGLKIFKMATMVKSNLWFVRRCRMKNTVVILGIRME